MKMKNRKKIKDLVTREEFLGLMYTIKRYVMALDNENTEVLQWNNLYNMIDDERYSQWFSMGAELLKEIKDKFGVLVDDDEN